MGAESERVRERVRGRAGRNTAIHTFTVGLRELECFEQAQGFVHVPAHREIVDGDLAERSLRVDQERSSAEMVVAWWWC